MCTWSPFVAFYTNQQRICLISGERSYLLYSLVLILPSALVVSNRDKYYIFRNIQSSPQHPAFDNISFGFEFLTSSISVMPFLVFEFAFFLASKSNCKRQWFGNSNKNICNSAKRTFACMYNCNILCSMLMRAQVTEFIFDLALRNEQLNEVNFYLSFNHFHKYANERFFVCRHGGVNAIVCLAV